MPIFQLRFSGDMLDERGEPACGYFGEDIYRTAPHHSVRLPHGPGPP